MHTYRESRSQVAADWADLPCQQFDKIHRVYLDAHFVVKMD